MVDIKILAKGFATGITPLNRQIANTCSDMLQVPHEIYYTTWNPWGNTPTKDVLRNLDYKHDVVLIMIEDCMISLLEHNWHKDHRPTALCELEQACAAHPDKQFVVFTDNFELRNLVEQANLHMVELPPWHCDTLHYFPVCEEKNFDLGKPWIFLNNTPSTLRITALCYVLNKNLHTHGTVTLSQRIYDYCQQRQHYYHGATYEMSASERKWLDQGWQRILAGDIEINHEMRNAFALNTTDNLINYKIHLLPKFKHTCLEIVSNTTFQDPYIFITEKTWQCIFGKNFPLILANPGTIAFMQQRGFDMFDDVLDHSYDSIQDPYQRLKALFDLNHDLLTQPEELKSLWRQHKKRFDHNINQLPTIKQDFVDRCLDQFRQVKTKINI